MINRILYFLAIFQICLASAEAVEPLKMPSQYAPQGVEVIVESLPIEGSQKWSLSERSIQSKIEQALMRFSLEPSSNEPFDKGYLYANVNLVGPSYTVRLEYKRRFWIDEQKENVTASVWQIGCLGIDPDYNNQTIYKALTEYTEQFSTEYIKQNRRKQ